MTPSKKLYFLETAWSYKLKFSGLSSFYDTNNWGKFEENLRRKGVKVWMIWHGTTQLLIEPGTGNIAAMFIILVSKSSISGHIL